jgi:hypothetical protein
VQKPANLPVWSKRQIFRLIGPHNRGLPIGRLIPLANRLKTLSASYSRHSDLHKNAANLASARPTANKFTKRIHGSGQAGEVLGQRYLWLGLIAPTEALQERRCLGILHGLVLCARGLIGSDRSRLRQWEGFLHNLWSGILYWLGRPGLCLRIFIGRPSLELIQHGFGWRLIDFGLTLKGSFKSGKQLIAAGRFPCSRRQGLRAGG